MQPGSSRLSLLYAYVDKPVLFWVQKKQQLPFKRQNTERGEWKEREGCFEIKGSFKVFLFCHLKVLVLLSSYLDCRWTWAVWTVFCRSTKQCRQSFVEGLALLCGSFSSPGYRESWILRRTRRRGSVPEGTKKKMLPDQVPCVLSAPAGHPDYSAWMLITFTLPFTQTQQGGKSLKKLWRTKDHCVSGHTHITSSFLQWWDSQS